ncbi:MAG TPA: hypothetical protein VHE35_00630 [Kofleriaceae bacterium]|nr:hypothetical protein [Kofleriaceae bacterium]
MNRLLFALLLAAALPACGDTRSPTAEIQLDHTHLDCPSDTLRLTIEGGFAPGTTVTFVMGDQSFDGAPVILDDGSIACGLPPGAPPGSYDLDVEEPGEGETVLHDAVTLDSDTCV